ncbi:glycerol-3-phosphate 1-O-acyltransferase PlsY [Desulfofundulus thermocisternus]|jgi:glycerol-3-phosphate acyltransferase PlsY|uniref:glycerol-3-phosphate 1-O-acyltransferase PlsY n=1 Tax=Desulfofundulus thermocisternus TaxID=42471 RepID=UPI001A046F4D|nr:glycerol-3-phosphate 1-O-acyltransferase PlsY [Desulfofundulus thermocisternus]MBE3584577.1 glycerol-3-phosphate 1-O-acyltransferase PlsY [Thermoanaerobacter sp.]MCS5696608.1 glycerol-3-phosphate 1-O-acyltransferase PlsY [Desulfofundulus thermocisternus]
MAVLAVVVSYLIGSIPVGYLLGRIRGIDIRKYGSGNIGTTNVWRNLGPVAGTIALIGDTGKGLLAVLLGRYLGGGGLELACGLAAIAGHSWPVFLGFRGGKIIATGLGVFLGLAPVAALLALGLWALVVVASGYVSLGSIVAAVSMPLWMLLLGRSREHLFFALLVAVIAVYKHIPNIRRLLAGTESKIR